MTTPNTPKKTAVVLLVDDDPGDQELTRRVFQEDVIRTDLRIANDGRAALDYLLRRGRFQDPTSSPRPDLILLDLNMPVMDGREVLKQLKGHAEVCSIPVIVMTTSKQEEDILRSYNLGCNSFIIKPINVEKFITVIRELSSYWFELVVLPKKAA